ncbi:hypothetical protein [Amycolatopsis pretoriensis]|uniref:hypothetical protein n=1 Tax=Amycolatopsis pretoriensis TaxID=218821 RepID=UPI00115FA8CD|nr:hypothetical protein [Amycolatopsis pretoriensis]
MTRASGWARRSSLAAIAEVEACESTPPSRAGDTGKWARRSGQAATAPVEALREQAAELRG